MTVLDLEEFGKLGRTGDGDHHEVLTVVDATFASPQLLSPLKYGLDVVIHSAYVLHNHGASLGNRLFCVGTVGYSHVSPNRTHYKQYAGSFKVTCSSCCKTFLLCIFNFKVKLLIMQARTGGCYGCCSTGLVVHRGSQFWEVYSKYNNTNRSRYFVDYTANEDPKECLPRGRCMEDVVACAVRPAKRPAPFRQPNPDHSFSHSSQPIV